MATLHKDYAQALFNLAQKPEAKAADLVKKLVTHLQVSGREKLLPHILREYKRIEARAEVLDESLEVASQSEKAAAVREAKEFGITAHANVNESLVSGWRAQKGSRVIDRSGKRALLDLYRTIARA